MTGKNAIHFQDLSAEEKEQLRVASKTYDTAIDEFLQSKRDSAKIEIDGVISATLYYGLKRTVKRRKLTNEVEVRGLNRGVVLIRK